MRNVIRTRIGTTKSHASVKSPSGQVWPNGEFGLGYYNEIEEVTWEEENGWYTTPDLSGDPDYAPKQPDPLTLSDVSNSHKPPGPGPGKYGLNGLTGYGAKMVRNGCYLLEQKLGRKDCFMWTFTVPTLGKPGRVELAKNWGKLTNRLVQYLARELGKSGRPPAIVGCTEIQTGRLEKYRQGYLHLHLICPGHSNNGGRYALDASEVRSWFHSALQRFSGQSNLPLPRVQVEPVRKSAEGYMAKYLSKGSGGELAGFIEDLGVESVPGQWWFASSAVKAKIKEAKRSGRNTGIVLEAVIQTAFEDHNLAVFEYIRHAEIQHDGRWITIGWYGKLRQDVADDLIKFLTS